MVYYIHVHKQQKHYFSFFLLKHLFISVFNSCNYMQHRTLIVLNQHNLLICMFIKSSYQMLKRKNQVDVLLFSDICCDKNLFINMANYDHLSSMLNYTQNAITMQSFKDHNQPIDQFLLRITTYSSKIEQPHLQKRGREA